MKRDDVLAVNALRAEITSAVLDMSQRLGAVFGEVVSALDTVLDRYNDLDAKHAQLEARLDTVSERLLALERLRGDGH